MGWDMERLRDIEQSVGHVPCQHCLDGTCPGQCPGHVQDIEIFLGHCPIPALDRPPSLFIINILFMKNFKKNGIEINFETDDNFEQFGRAFGQKLWKS